MGVRSMEGGYIKPSKIQTFSSNTSNESLKWSKESAPGDPNVYTHLFKIKV